MFKMRRARYLSGRIRFTDDANNRANAAVLKIAWASFADQLRLFQTAALRIIWGLTNAA